MIRIALFAFMMLGALSAPSQAFDADRLTIQVGFGPGAAFDLIARAAGNHIGKYLPGNPEVIVENVEGAGSLRLLNLYLAGGARDGSQVVMISAGIALDPILNPGQNNFNPADFNYLVSFSNYPTYCLTTVASGITTFDQLITEEVRIGAVAANRDATYFAAAGIDRAFNANFDIVTGFTGIAEINLALARGELDAVCGRSFSSLEATREIFDFHVVAELSPQSFGLVEGAEFILDRVSDPLTRAALSLVFSSSLVWFPMMAHPDTPDATVAILRDAFAALATDEAFLAEMVARGIDVSITHGADMQALIEGFLSTPAEVQAAARALIE